MGVPPPRVNAKLLLALYTGIKLNMANMMAKIQRARSPFNSMLSRFIKVCVLAL